MRIWRDIIWAICPVYLKGVINPMKKDTWLKVILIIVAVALVFTIVASNIVSITAISVLRKAKTGNNTVITDDTVPTSEDDVTDDSVPADAPETGGETVDSVDNTANTASGTNTTTKSNTTTAKASDMPQSKSEVLEFYRSAVNKIKNNAAAGYTKKEWQALPVLNIGTLGNILNSFIDRFMTTESDAEEQIAAKGSSDAKNRFPQCTLNDLSKIASATCTGSGSNYKITIIMVDEKNPTKSKNFLGQITNSILYEEDIRTEVDGLTFLGAPLVGSGYTFDITYKAFKITAVITKDGKFVSLDHFAEVPIKANAKVAKIYTLDGDAILENYCKYYDFKY